MKTHLEKARPAPEPSTQPAPAERPAEREGQAGAGDQDVQPALAPLAVERPKVHRQAPLGRAPVADADEDHVALVPLHALQVLEEEGLGQVGRVGDGWLAVPRAPAELARDVAAIRREAEAAGRDPSRIGVAASGGARSVAELLDRIPALERAGATIVTVPALFWAASVPQAIDLMDEFASRADLERRE